MDAQTWWRWWRLRGRDDARAAVLQHWDPIGVADEPLAQGEYDGYLDTLAAKLRDGASVEDVAAHLSDVEREWMGFDTTAQMLIPGARAIVAAYERSLRPTAAPVDRSTGD